MKKIWIIFFLVCNTGTQLASAVHLHSSEDVMVEDSDRHRGVPAVKPNVPKCAPRDGLGIINGEEAVPHSWPWQVSLQRTGHVHYCGGSLINERWVVTAAHCKVSESDRVILGQHNLKDRKNDPKYHDILKVFKYDAYNEETKDNDIKLIKLKEPALIDRYVSLVRLPDTSDIFPPGTACVVTGWGRTHWGSTKPAEKLQQACVPLVSFRDCNSNWYWGRVTPSMLCAGGVGANICIGDSGGPLVCEKNGKWILVGLTSWALLGCPTNEPAVFANVPTLVAWIHETMADNP